MYGEKILNSAGDGMKQLFSFFSVKMLQINFVAV